MPFLAGKCRFQLDLARAAMNPETKTTSREFAESVVLRLRNAGHEALFAGGCVRDQILGFEPKDYDVATSAHPDEVRAVFGHRRTIAVGAAFGVITVLGGKAGQVEVATFRQDIGYSDGRHPDRVQFCSAEQDAKRRDFTINGLFYDPVDQLVIDYVEGQLDLNRGIIRAIGNPSDRFDEDRLRMLRAVRFAATFRFAIDPATIRAIQEHHPSIVIVSAERIAGEMQRMLTHPHRRTALELLRTTSLLDQLVPELSHLLQIDDSDRVWHELLAVQELLPSGDFALVLAALLRPLLGDHGTSIVDAICQRWKLTNEVRKVATWLLQHEAEILQADRLPWSRIQPLLANPHAGSLVGLAEAIVRVSDAARDAVAWCRQRLHWPRERLNPQPLISGRDLIAAGLHPNPRFAHALRAVRDAQLDQQITTATEALRLAQAIYASGTEANGSEG